MMDADYFRSENIKPLKPVEPIMTDRDRIEKDKVDGFLIDLESDIKQYGLTDSIRESARAVFFQIVKELGYTRQPSQDKVEAVAQRIGELYCGKFKWEHLDDFTDGSYWHELVHGAAREILKLFLEYVPVELEALGDEDLKYLEGEKMEVIRVYTETTCEQCGVTNLREGAEGFCPPVDWAEVRLTFRHEGIGWTSRTGYEKTLCPQCAEKVRELISPNENKGK